MKKNKKIEEYFNQKKELTISNKKYLNQVEFITSHFLKEDLDNKGDITTKILIKKNPKVKAAIYTKETGILAGVEEVEWFLKKYKIKLKKYKKDGDKLKNKEVILELNGKIKDILVIERTVLNILQRMSGIATETKKYVRKAKKHTLVCSTRKTQWGLLDKKAVVLGGGGTHRLGLHDFILVKDNHLEFLQNKIDKKAEYLNKKKMFWEIEVKECKQALWAAALEPGAIMFDNMKPKKIKDCINKISKHYPEIIFEASGNINYKKIKKYRKAGVDIISVGSLTHSTKALDISLDIL